jgi:uncharacterized protein
MHINVRDILAESVGHSRAYKITGERPELEGIRLTRDIEGEITISRLDTGLLVRGHISTEIELECHRCLRTFDRPVEVNFSQLFTQAPDADEFPVEDDTIDLAPLLAQEIIVSLPIKILCKPDCKGIENISEKYTKEDTTGDLKHQARITKGK